ncbi:flavodoxin domain-containing protein [Spirochaetota bacterium]
MNVLIIYFSQTGNTEKIAEIINNGILMSGNKCDTIKIKEAHKFKLEEYDLVGLGVPTFYYREPRNITSFIKDMADLKGKHFFLFCSHGTEMGNTFYYMKEELNKKGIIVVASFDSYAESSLQFYPETIYSGAKVIVSKAAPTSLSVELARENNIILIANVRSNRFDILNGKKFVKV